MYCFSIGRWDTYIWYSFQKMKCTCYQLSESVNQDERQKRAWARVIHVDLQRLCQGQRFFWHKKATKWQRTGIKMTSYMKNIWIVHLSDSHWLFFKLDRKNKHGAQHWPKYTNNNKYSFKNHSKFSPHVVFSQYTRYNKRIGNFGDFYFLTLFHVVFPVKTCL